MESSKPSVSVIIPVYNKERFLGKTIGSVLNQSFQDFELILVLDPSTDNSSDIAYSYSDKRVRILERSEPGPGGYAARNLGVKLASADWITFLDADDIWYPNFLEKMLVSKSEQPNYSFFISGYSFERNGAQRLHPYTQGSLNIGSHEIDFRNFLISRPISTINLLIKKETFLCIGGFPEVKFRRGADHETWLRLINHCRYAWWVAFNGAIYNRDDIGSVTKANKHYTKNHPLRLRVLNLLKERQNAEVRTELKLYSNSFVLSGLKALLRQGNLRVADLKSLFWSFKTIKKVYVYLLILAFLPKKIQVRVIHGRNK